jgi:hypothetical protein
VAEFVVFRDSAGDFLVISGEPVHNVGDSSRWSSPGYLFTQMKGRGNSVGQKGHGLLSCWRLLFPDPGALCPLSDSSFCRV